MKLLFGITLLLSLLASGVSLNAIANENVHGSTNSLRAGYRPIPEGTCSSIMDIICSSAADTKTFCEMVTKAAKKDTDFADGLEGGKSYTVFAPTDEAFENFEKELLQLKPDDLHRTILFHFYGDVVMTYDDLECSSKLTSLTSDTSRTKCQRISDGVYEKNQRGRGNKDIGVYPLINTQSKEACSGIVHSISNVLLPIVFKPFKSMVIVDDEDFEEAIIINKEEDEKEEDEEEVVEEEKEVEKEVVEEEKPVDEENNDVLIIDNSTSAIGWGDAEKPEETPAGTQTEKNAVGEEEQKPRIGALGINLIIFSTLLLCFVFVCMRR